MDAVREQQRGPGTQVGGEMRGRRRARRRRRCRRRSMSARRTTGDGPGCQVVDGRAVAQHAQQALPAEADQGVRGRHVRPLVVRPPPRPGRTSTPARFARRAAARPGSTASETWGVCWTRPVGVSMLMKIGPWEPGIDVDVHPRRRGPCRAPPRTRRGRRPRRGRPPAGRAGPARAPSTRPRRPGASRARPRRPGPGRPRPPPPPRGSRPSVLRGARGDPPILAVPAHNGAPAAQPRPPPDRGPNHALLRATRRRRRRLRRPPPRPRGGDGARGVLRPRAVHPPADPGAFEQRDAGRGDRRRAGARLRVHRDQRRPPDRRRQRLARRGGELPRGPRRPGGGARLRDDPGRPPGRRAHSRTDLGPAARAATG